MTGRGRGLLAAGLVVLILGLVLGGVALALRATSADPNQDTADDARPDTSTDPGTLAPGDSTTESSPADGSPGSAETTTPAGATTSLMTPPTASPDELAALLRDEAAAAGFPVLGSADADWELVSVDAGSTNQGPYVATSYERGQDYFSTSQERAASFPEMPNTTPVTVRGLQGDLLDMGHVVVIRWVENGTSIIFSTSLARADALAEAESLQPIR